MDVLRVAADRAWLAAALAILENGGIVCYPTDTLYGLAVDPRNEAAVARLYRAKLRDSAAAIPLVAASLEQAKEVGHFSDADQRLAEAFWPGPLSIVVPATALVSRRLLGEAGTIAVRVPASDVARELAGAFGCAITATSANLSGALPAVKPTDLMPALIDRIDAVVDAGAAPAGPPSTIVELARDGPRLLRAGPVAWARVLEFLR